MAGKTTIPFKDGGGGSRTALAGSDASANTATAMTLFDVNGNPISVLPVSLATPPVTKADRSGTIASGGTAQQVSAANAARLGYTFQNVSAADLFLNETGTASATVSANSGSIKVAAGQLYEPPPGGVPATAISVYGAAAGQAFTFKEW